jgi:hypothetical protein
MISGKGVSAMRVALLVVASFVVACSQESSAPPAPSKPAACSALAGAWSFTEARATPKDGTECDVFGERFEGTLTIAEDLSTIVESYASGESVTYTVTGASIGDGGDVCAITSQSRQTLNGIDAEQTRSVIGRGSRAITITQASVSGAACSARFDGTAER